MSLGNATMTIFGDSISGNCLKVKWVAERLGIPFEWVEVRVLDKETRTPEFLALNPAGQVPVVQFGDGRVLAQSNAIIRYLARGSGLVPSDPFSAAQMDAWMFWEQNSHEPYVAVCRFQIVYLGKPVSALDPNLVTRGYVALDHMERRLETTRFLIGDDFSLADIALVAYTRVAHEGGFDLTRYAALRRWIGEAGQRLGLSPAR